MKKELLIFGANGALGQGVTETLFNKDFDKIYLFDFRLKGLEQYSGVADRIEIKDLADEANVVDAFSNVLPSKDKLFFLFSTVGGFSGGKAVWETEESELSRMLDKNLKSSFLLAKHFSLLVKNSAGGSICFTSAYTAIEAERGKGAYGLAKAALVHLVKTLAIEGKEINLTANAIAPYIIDTPANREWMKKGNYKSWLKPHEVGELVYDIFRNFYFISGNIMQLTNRMSLDDAEQM